MLRIHRRLAPLAILVASASVLAAGPPAGTAAGGALTSSSASAVASGRPSPGRPGATRIDPGTVLPSPRGGDANVVAMGASGLGPAPLPYLVGAAKADITPPNLAGVHLGGYGIGPVHPAKGVLRHIFVRVLAVRDQAGAQVVIGALDVQGHFLAYQNGPYGFADIAADIQTRLHIPAGHIVLQATHTHNGPDDLGVWGGVPASYLAYVKAQTESAIRQAVAAERPATLAWATADMTGFAGTFGPDQDRTHTGDTRDYPLDNQMRVLQAVDANHAVIATLVNLSTHPTIYGPLDRVSPDWPGATATFLEHQEIGIPAASAYGYPGSVAVVTVGALGHSWPSGPPRGTDPAVDPARGSDNHDADVYGNAVARVAMAALLRGTPVRGSRVDGASRAVTVEDLNPALAALLLPNPALHVERRDTPPYGAGPLLTTVTTALRIGDLAVVSAPGEAYPTIETTLRRQVHATLVLPMSLAGDQLGYIGEVGDYNGAMQCSSTDEGFFMISPLFGTQVESAQRANAAAVGFRVDRPALDGVSAGRVPPPAACTRQQLPHSLPPPAAAPGIRPATP